eukprot:17375-Heterococcus_DN1.PRE.3
MAAAAVAIADSAFAIRQLVTAAAVTESRRFVRAASMIPHGIRAHQNAFLYDRISCHNANLWTLKGIEAPRNS